MSQYGTKTVTTTATLIVAPDSNRKELRIVNSSEDTIVYLGMDSSVTIANGVPLYETQTQNNWKNIGSWLGAVYGITASGTADVRYWEVSQA